MPVGVVMMKEKICDAVEQHTPTEDGDPFRSEGVANPQGNEDKRHRVEDVEDILPLREEIPF